MGLVHIEKKIVEYYQCNMFGDMTMSSLIDVMMITSGRQDKSLVGLTKFLQTSHLVWVITQNEIEISRLPHYNEVITIKTEATDYNSFFTYRDFEIRDQENNILVTAQTTFTLINLDNRKIVRIPQEVIDDYDVVAQNKKAVRKRLPNKLDNISQNDQYRVEFLDIDNNGHVNNTIYLKWLTNSLGKQWFEQYQLKHISIKYDKEIMFGDEVDVFSDLSRVYSTDERPFSTLHVIKSENGKHSSAELIWIKNK